MPQVTAPEAPLVDTRRSPNAILRPVSVGAVTLLDQFWAPRIERNRTVTLQSQLRQCEETGRIDNFRVASGRKAGKFQGIYFNDSDVYKWLEAASWALACRPDATLERQVDEVVDEIAAAQQPDGYLNSYFMFDRAGERFSNLKDMHEIYCAGHLFQAAAAHYRATGKRSLLDTALRLADCFDARFGSAPGKSPGACGHEEAEMGLVELYRCTGESRYLNLARFMIDSRGQTPGLFGNSAYHQDHIPFTEQTEMIGHAVRHMYLCCGAADVALEESGTGYETALETLWQNFTTKRMYVSGGAGSRYEGEAFGVDYELPNDRAYTETCAAIGSVMWNWRMLLMTGEARFADLLEHTLYNAVLPGLSLDGEQYFYQNPLTDTGGHRRQAWFGCACCPPNVARLLASVSGMFYAASDEGIAANLYATGTATLELNTGEQIVLAQRTHYPWDGEVEILTEQAANRPYTLSLRIPAWADGAAVTVNGESAGRCVPGEYARLHRMWAAGDVVRLTLPMTVKRLRSHPRVAGNAGRRAIVRGPILYCLEKADSQGSSILDIAISEEAPLTARHDPSLLSGVTVLEGTGEARDLPEGRPLYSDKPATLPPAHSVPVTAIPYYAWANREPGPMQVWIPTTSG